MKILGIETSCDETSAAVIEADGKDKHVKLLSFSLATSLAKHAVTGGIIPEAAAREQLSYFLPVLTDAVGRQDINAKNPGYDAIAVTYGPGLIGSLLVGIESAKTLAYLWDIPLLPVNHLYGHIFANMIEESTNSSVFQAKVFPSYPAIALVVSGGHTDLVLMKTQTNLEPIGGTRDDAAGEAFDKIGRLLGLSYPAGAVISELALQGNPKKYRLPRPMWDSKDYDFSFSGLKTAVYNLIRMNGWTFSSDADLDNSQLIADLCASVQESIVDVLVFKTFQAVRQYGVRSLLLGGGVAANELLRFKIYEKANKETAGELEVHIPEPIYCTDNAAMIAAAGFFTGKATSWKEVYANPELYY